MKYEDLFLIMQEAAQQEQMHKVLEYSTVLRVDTTDMHFQVSNCYHTQK